MKTNRQRWQTILAAITETQPHEFMCSEISDEMFTLYAETLIADRKPTGELASVEQHLRHCPDCAQQLTDVTAALRLAANMDVMTQSLTSRPFDLSFLQPPTAGNTLPERVQAAFTRGVAWVQDQRGDLWINLAVDSGLVPSSEYVSTTKGGGKEQQLDNAKVLYQLVLGAEEVDDLDLEVIGRREGQSDFCTLTVQAVIPSRWPRTGGVEVDLLSGMHIRHARTDEDGQAIFRKIPVAELPEIRVRVAR